MTARNDSELPRKAGARPTVLMRTAATAGPTMRAVLNTALLRATALDTSSGPTISMTNDWRVGLSTTVTHPATNTSAYTIHSSTTPVVTTRNMANASTAAVLCVITSTRRLSNRSAINPPHMPASSIGVNWRAVVTPRATPLPVSLSTSQLWAVICIHVPVSETSWPAKKRR